VEVIINNVDIWSLGILCYELICGFPPFETETQTGTYERIKKVDLGFPRHVSEEAIDLISKILILDPSDRLELEEICSHPWIIKNASLHIEEDL